MVYTLHLGDCIGVMRAMEEASIDSIVTDPPYGLEFMGKEWDAPWKATAGGFSAPGIGDRKTDWPSFKGSNRSRCADCGLLVGQGGSPCKCANPRPILQDAMRMRAFQDWCEQWAREALRVLKPGGHLLAFGGSRTYHRLATAIEDAGFEIRDQIMWIYGSGFPKSRNMDGAWSGWGTALKPAHEPICVARKPLAGTVAANVLAHGTGALNIDGCRVGDVGGRWPANVIHDGSAETLAAFPNAPGQLARSREDGTAQGNRIYGAMLHGGPVHEPRSETSESAARFFYCAKASRADRNEGLDALPDRFGGMTSNTSGRHITRRDGWVPDPVKNHHPTVKPTPLMRYLCRLVTPPGGVVLDPFMGSGSTGKAALLEGFRFIGCELQAEYIEIARARIQQAGAQEQGQYELEIA